MYAMNEASPATRVRNGRNGTTRGPSDAVDLRDTIRFEVNTVMKDDKQVNDQRNKLTKRHIVGLSVALTLFGVAVGGGIVYLCYWIHFDSGMSKYCACLHTSNLKPLLTQWLSDVTWFHSTMDSSR